MFRPLFRRSASFPLVLSCSRSLVGVDAESFEVVQETPHPLFLLAPHTARVGSYKIGTSSLCFTFILAHSPKKKLFNGRSESNQRRRHLLGCRVSRGLTKNQKVITNHFFIVPLIYPDFLTMYNMAPSHYGHPHRRPNLISFRSPQGARNGCTWGMFGLVSYQHSSPRSFLVRSKEEVVGGRRPLEFFRQSRCSLSHRRRVLAYASLRVRDTAFALRCLRS